jgi:predicted secreted protein
MLFSLLLAATAAAAPATTAPQTEPKPEPMICKREPVTGSLARFRKVCRTESKWRQVGEQAQDEARNMQDRGLINSCSSPPCG